MSRRLQVVFEGEIDHVLDVIPSLRALGVTVESVQVWRPGVVIKREDSLKLCRTSDDLEPGEKVEVRLPAQFLAALMFGDSLDLVNVWYTDEGQVVRR